MPMANMIDRYDIIETLYESKKTSVYRGVDMDNQQPCVLKVLNKNHTSYRDISSLKREYSLLKALGGKSIIEAYNMEVSGDSAYMAIQDIGGQSLLRYMNDDALPMDMFMEIALKTVDALDQIHGANIIHKDINPGNILWNHRTKDLRIIDFDIAAKLLEEKFELRPPEMLEGTIRYISPEQTGRINRSMDYRTDFYSLGITLYHLITGILPIDGKDAMEIVHGHIAKAPKKPTDIDDKIPVMLSDIIMKLIEKDPDKRYQSIHGIRSDLKKVAVFLKEGIGGGILIPGADDISSVFHIPEKLYGREEEISTLMSVYDEACDSSRQLLLIAGYSGVGKSALVREIHKPIIVRNGFFIEGKFDQFTSNVPYSGLIQAFRELVALLLKLPEKDLENYRIKILSELQDNAGLLTALIPELIAVVGNQAAAPELGPAEAQKRLMSVFSDFIKVFASKDHPLTLFLDDLQWCGIPTLKLLESLILDRSVQHLLIIGAYRDNEVDSGHPLTMMCHDIEKTKEIKRLVIRPLKKDMIARMVTDTLHRTREQVEQLVDLIYAKTEGNPFFTKELMSELYRSHLFTFDTEMNHWTWDLFAVNKVKISDNVVDFVVGKLRILPASSLHILKLAACISNQFDLNTLTLISELDRQTVAASLWSSIEHRFLIPLDENYRLIHYLDQADAHTNIRLRFSHDRVQQAAKELIDEASRNEIHLRIGRLLLKNTDKNSLDNRIIEIMRHYDEGLELITDLEERTIVRALNQRAGDKAKASSAFGSAMNYYGNGIQLLREASWQNNYEETFALYTKYTETAYLCTQNSVAEAYSNIILEKARSGLDRAKLRMIQLNQYHYFGNSDEAIAVGQMGLLELGIKVPTYPSQLLLMKALIGAKIKLKNTTYEVLFERETIEDEAVLLSLKMLMAFIPPAYMTGKEALFGYVVLQAVRLVLKYGNSDVSSAVYTGYAALMSGLGNHDEAYEFGQLGMRLSQHYGKTRWNCMVQTLYGLYGCSWFESWDGLSTLFLEAVTTGRSLGDDLYAPMACSFVAVWNPRLNIQEVLTEMNRLRAYVETAGHDFAVMQMQVIYYTFNNLSGLSKDYRSLDTDDFDEQQLVGCITEIKYNVGLAIYYGYKTQLSYIYGEYEAAYKYMEDTKGYMTPAGTPYDVNDTLFRFLTLAALVSSSNKDDKWRKMLKLKKRIDKWAKMSPEYFSQYGHIAEAEYNRLTGNIALATNHYELAAMSARQLGNIRNTAIFNELAGRFYLESGLEKAGIPYLNDALTYYRMWGANYKVGKFYDQYGYLIRRHYANTAMSQTVTNASTTTIQLDTQSIIKASRAISQLIVRELLVKKIMEITLESAGAQKGCMLLKKEGILYLEEIQIFEGDPIELDGPVTVADEGKWENRQYVSSRIVHYVERTKRTLVLDDAYHSEIFGEDLYIKKEQSKSVLCIPVLFMNEVKAVLYFENNLATGIFNPERVAMIEVIASQAAISLENSELYANLEEKVSKRTRQLENLTEKFKLLSVTDQLTRLNNRRKIDEVLAYEYEQASRYKIPLSVILMDIDKFKDINDQYGHQAGDRVLVEFGQVLQSRIRSADTLGRWGGEEFVIICPETDEVNAAVLAEQLRAEIANHKFDSAIPVTSSFGVSQLKSDISVDRLLMNADRALYEAKGAGRNCVRVYD